MLKPTHEIEKEPLLQLLLNGGSMQREHAEQIAERFQFKTLNADQIILREGKTADEYLFLAKGYIRAFATDTEGNDITTDFFTPGRMVFEVASFFNRIPSKENLMTLTDCEVFSINYSQLTELFHTMPQFRDFGRSILVKGFSALKTRMLSQITETAEERYQRLLQTQPDIFQYAPLKYIASYLGITDSSLSRIRKELTKKH